MLELHRAPRVSLKTLARFLTELNAEIDDLLALNRAKSPAAVCDSDGDSHVSVAAYRIVSPSRQLAVFCSGKKRGKKYNTHFSLNRRSVVEGIFCVKLIQTGGGVVKQHAPPPPNASRMKPATDSAVFHSLPEWDGPLCRLQVPL